MRIHGVIKEAEGEKALPNAKIRLLVGDRELACFYSGSNGQFNHQEASSYIGETLICEVQKEEYQHQKITYNIEEENLELEIELVPLQKEKIASKVKQTSVFEWKLPAYGLIGGAIGGLIGTGVAKIDPIFFDKFVYGTALGVALGLGLNDKKKMIKFIFGGSIGFFTAGLIWIMFLKGIINIFWNTILVSKKLPILQAVIIYATWLGVGGLGFGALLKEPKTLLKLFLAGLIAGAIGGPLSTAVGMTLGKVGGPSGIALALAIWNALLHALGGLAFGIILAINKKVSVKG